MSIYINSIDNRKEAERSKSCVYNTMHLLSWIDGWPTLFLLTEIFNEIEPYGSWQDGEWCFNGVPTNKLQQIN